MATFNLSSNIENGQPDDFRYIVTPNARKAVSDIVENYHAGIHSYTIIGSYGTGKSSFLIEFENSLTKSRTEDRLLEPSVLSNNKSFDIINIVGDYCNLETLIARKIGATGTDTMQAFANYYERCSRARKFLIIVVDEFGKVLEHASRNNPEQELYFVQKLAEYVNVPKRQILLLTTLHQNFGAYANHLNEEQQNEWRKVKGRFKEIAFVEPIEQLLHMASLQLIGDGHATRHSNTEKICRLAIETGYVESRFDKSIARSLYPMDVFSAYAMTTAIQRYGQNERSLFSFLAARGEDSLYAFDATETKNYSVANVYDYVVSNFYSFLKEKNSDTMEWSSVRMALDRVVTIGWENNYQTTAAINIVKTIGLLNMYGNAGFRMSQKQLAEYANLAMAISDAENIINRLEKARIIRFAQYKGRLMIYDGTDVDIEKEFHAASLIVQRPQHYINDIRQFFCQRVAPVRAHFYQKGTPRFFEFMVLDAPVDICPTGDNDGFVELIFSTRKKMYEQVIEASRGSSNAIIFVLFTDTNVVVERLYNIKKYKYLLENIIDKSDRVAFGEVKRLIEYEEEMLNKEINDELFSYGKKVRWIFAGKVQQVSSHRDFNKLLSDVCNKVYNLTPVIHNELFNRHKLSSTIASARKNYLTALLAHTYEDDLGFAKDKFPPEKTIYYTLLKDNGLHIGGTFGDVPCDDKIKPLWESSERFLKETEVHAKKSSELIRRLSLPPYKIKQGVLDFWIPTYLFLRRNDISLYDAATGSFIPNMNIEFFNLLQKHPADYLVKKIAIDGMRLDFFNEYRRFVNLGEEQTLSGDKIIETIKPFISFYIRLNDYAKHTRKFDHKTTLLFRDVLAKAKDPEQTFFEDLPDALGFDKTKLNDGHSMREYGHLIEIAIRELRTCYLSLIDRIEARIVDDFCLCSYDYNDYITEIRSRLSNIKKHLLTEKQKEFYSHVMTEYDNRVQWYQSICYTLLDQRLDTIRDEQEELLIDNLVYSLRECEKYAEITKMAHDDGSVAFSFDMATNVGVSVRARTYVIPVKERNKVESIERRIEQVLTGSTQSDVCALLSVLKKKIQ